MNNNQPYLTIQSNLSATWTIKRSVFKTYIVKVESSTQLSETLNHFRQHQSSDHLCYAYVLWTPTGIVYHASDGDEPAGTAGLPLLNVLFHYHLVNIVVISLRDYGGIMLGAGGLIKAYQQGALAALSKNKQAFILAQQIN